MHLRSFIARSVPAVLVVCALAGFWVLSSGMTTGLSSITGYAETRTHNVGPLSAARLKEVKVTLGQSVRAGDVVAIFDGRMLELQRSRLGAMVRQAQAQLKAQEDIERAQLQRQQLQAVRTYSGAERSRAELRELNQQVARMQALKKDQLIRASEVEEARRRQQALVAELAARPKGSVQQQQQMGLRPRSQEDQEGRLMDRLAPFRAALDVHEASLREVEQALSELTLRAPVDGTVGSILQQPGDVLAAGAPVLTIVTARPGHVVAFIPERQSRRIALGTQVRLRRFGSLADAMPGRVVELAPLVEQAPVRVTTLLTAPTFARRIVIRLDQDTVLLPGEAFHVALR